MYFVNPMTESLKVVDVRLQLIQLPPQPIMTKDNVVISIDAVLYFKVHDPVKAVYRVGMLRAAIGDRSQTALREVLGRHTLQDCIEHRDGIAQEMKAILQGPVQEWGAQIESVLIKDLKFSQDLMETLSSAAKAKRVGESKIITAQCEVESAKLMREAADILSSGAAMQIRYLEALQNITAHGNSKIILLPMEGISHIVQTGALLDGLLGPNPGVLNPVSTPSAPAKV